MAPSYPEGSLLLVKKWGYGHHSLFGLRLGNGGMSAPLERADVIVFDYPTNPSVVFVKRVIGLPGDVIDIDQQRVTINGQQLKRRARDDLRDAGRFEETLGKVKYDVLHAQAPFSYPYATGTATRTGCTVNGEQLRCTVPAQHYFVMGDNRDDSLDSRIFGAVPEKLVVGKVMCCTADDMGGN